MAAGFVFQGLRQGFTRLLIGLVATLVGLLLAAWFYGTAGAFLIPYVSSKSLANIAGFLLVFLGVQLFGAALAWGLGKLFKWTGLTWLDRLLGAAFGLLKATLIGIILVIMLLAFPLKPAPESVANSTLAPYIIEASHILVYLTPRELKDGFLGSYDRVKKLWQGLPAPPDNGKKPEKSSV